MFIYCEEKYNMYKVQFTCNLREYIIYYCIVHTHKIKPYLPKCVFCNVYFVRNQMQNEEPSDGTEHRILVLQRRLFLFIYYFL